jgi:hypothetical protein
MFETSRSIIKQLDTLPDELIGEICNFMHVCPYLEELKQYELTNWKAVTIEAGEFKTRREYHKFNDLNPPHLQYTNYIYYFLTRPKSKGSHKNIYWTDVLEHDFDPDEKLYHFMFDENTPNAYFIPKKRPRMSNSILNQVDIMIIKTGLCAMIIMHLWRMR